MHKIWGNKIINAELDSKKYKTCGGQSLEALFGAWLRGGARADSKETQGLLYGEYEVNTWRPRPKDINYSLL